MRGGLPVLPIIVFQTQLALSAPPPRWLPLVESLPCAASIQRKLVDWRAADEVLRAPSGPAGTKAYRIATEAIGIWLTLHWNASARAASIFRTSSSGTVRVDFDSDCRAVASPVEGLPEPPVGGLTDLELGELVARHHRLVIYWWSPHLPLSVEGYFEIQRATDDLGIPWVALVDPSADEGFVRETAARYGIPSEACRVSASVELLFRDIAVHAPAILLFTDGKAGPPLPGYRNARSYRDYLSRASGTEP